MSTATQNQIDLENVGPIERLSIPIPEGGGLVVLKGINGSGKSQALAAVESLYSKQARKGLRNSDGTPAGRITGLGVTIRLGRSNTAKGELVCESLDGRIDPSVLVDPGLKDPEAADSRRLAVLVRLSGIELGLDAFKEALGSEVDEIDLEQCYDTDPVSIADRIRRKLHEVALEHERRAKRMHDDAMAVEKSIKDVDTEGESDAEKLSAAVDAATSALASKQQQQMDQLDARERREEAKRLLDENAAKAIDAEEAKGDLAELKESLSSKETAIVEKRAEIERLKQELQGLENDKQNLELRVEQHAERLEMAEAQAEQLARWRGIVEADQPGPVEASEIEELKEAKSKAIAAMQQGEVVRRALGQLDDAKKKHERAEEKNRKGERLRALARSTDQVLESKLVDAGFDSIKVSYGRLCVESDRGLEPFSDLSHGERWRLALDLAAKGLKAGAVLPVCQEAFESLDPENRSQIRAMARERGLVLITAEASEGKLRSEVLG